MEIERKFLIRMPRDSFFKNAVNVYAITQDYLKSKNGYSRRVRTRENLRTSEKEYFYTEKKDVATGVREENETQITYKEYMSLLKQRDDTCMKICKVRYVIPNKGKNFEIDIYSFWRAQAIMEVELNDINEPFEIPKGVIVNKEVTKDKRYTNHSLAKTQGRIKPLTMPSHLSPEDMHLRKYRVIVDKTASDVITAHDPREAIYTFFGERDIEVVKTLKEASNVRVELASSNKPFVSFYRVRKLH